MVDTYKRVTSCSVHQKKEESHGLPKGANFFVCECSCGVFSGPAGRVLTYSAVLLLNERTRTTSSSSQLPLPSQMIFFNWLVLVEHDRDSRKPASCSAGYCRKYQCAVLFVPPCCSTKCRGTWSMEAPRPRPIFLDIPRPNFLDPLLTVKLLRTSLLDKVPGIVATTGKNLHAKCAKFHRNNSSTCWTRASRVVTQAGLGCILFEFKSILDFLNM